jgi:gamma-glutamyltranspeptidase / glutathione hydrolase
MLLCADAEQPGLSSARLTERNAMRLCLIFFLISIWTCASADVGQPAGTATVFGMEAAKPAKRFMVAAPHPLASEAGRRMLKAGGSAVDAAVAVQMVLTLVEPQSSGIGGGAFLMHFDGKAVEAWDGRETAPAAADESLFLGADGKPMAFHDGVVGGRSVGVPGVVAMLEAAHKRHGRLPWEALFAPAIELAEQGFAISPTLADLLAKDEFLRRDPQAAAYFYDAAGKPWPAGHRLKNPELAAVLREIAARGSAAMLGGKTAQAIVGKVRGHPNPGRLSLDDLAAYRPLRRDALCTGWRAWRICGFPPPSSGGIAIAQILGLLERRPAPPSGISLREGIPGAAFLHDYAEASRLAFADRGRYVGDPDFVVPPAGRWDSLFDPNYLDRRARLIGERSAGKAAPGDPASDAPQASIPDDPAELPATAHLSVVDAEGRAVAMTTTVEDRFGARLMVRGFLLNNQLTDFSFVPREEGRPVANRVEARKRPRSSMSPTLVFDKASGRLVLVVGSPGGAQIIHYTAKTILGVLAMGLTPQQAIELPNFGSLGGPTVIETGRFAAAVVDALKARGHELREQALYSGIQAIAATPAGLLGGADPRREGTVIGE